MRLRISHSTSYRYDPPATGVIQILRMTPGSHDGQYVAEWQIDVSTDSRLDVHQDAFGNVTHVLTHGPIAELTINVDERVYDELQRIGGPDDISQFIESLILRKESDLALESAYQQMASDTTREAEALEWAEATIGDADAAR